MTDLTISEAQHHELVTGGDAYGTPGLVEDVTEIRDFSDAEDAADPEPEASYMHTGAPTETTDTGSEDNKAALLALGAIILVAAIYGGTRQ